MGTIKGTIAFFCISFLATYWSGGSLGVSASVLPLHRHAALSSSNCDCYGTSSISQNPSYESLLSSCLTSGDTSPVRKQQLLSQASSLLKQLSPVSCDGSSNIKTPFNKPIENHETILLQNLVNRLQSLKQNSAVALDTSSSNSPAVSQATYNSIENQYLEIKLLALDLLTPENAEVVQSALDALYKTFVNIVTGQLLNAELPNLCSKTLALNSQMAAIDAPTELQKAVTDFIKSLTLALTGQSQVTISGLCECLNDLETSVVTVVGNDHPEKLQYLLLSLVDAVTNTVVSGGDIGCNVVNIVKRYAASIQQAIQEDTNVRARQIYNSILNFEEELYQVLTACESSTTTTTTPPSTTTTTTPPSTTTTTTPPSTSTTTTPSSTTTTTTPPSTSTTTTSSWTTTTTTPSSTITTTTPPSTSTATTPGSTTTTTWYPETEEDCVNGVQDLSKAIFGDRLNLVKPAVKILLDIKEAEDPAPDGESTSTNSTEATLKNLQKVVDLLNSVSSNPQKDSTHVIDALVKLLRTLPENDVSKVLDALDPVTGNNSNPDPLDDATVIVSNGELFIIKQLLIRETDDEGNVINIAQNGTYQLVDPTTKCSWTGSYTVENGTIQSEPNGNLDVESKGVYNVDPPQDDSSTSGAPRVKRQANFELADNLVVQIDKNGNTKITEDGTYTLTDRTAGTSKSGNFVVENSVSKSNPDGSTEIIKSGVLYVDDSSDTSPSEEPSIEDGSQYILFNDHIFESPDSDGNLGTGMYNIKNPETDESQSGTYVIKELTKTENSDGSVNTTTSGVIYVNSQNSDSDSFIADGSQFTFDDQLTYVTDDYGHVTPIITGEFTAVDPQTGKYDSASYVFQSIVTAENPDGSTDITKFGILSNNCVTTSTTESPTTPSSSSESPGQIAIDFGQPWLISKDSFESRINSLNPIKHIQSSAGQTTTQSPTTTDSTYTFCDATSVVTNSTSFIIDKVITPLVDPEGNVFGHIIMGTYHLMDYVTNHSWSGAFEVEQSSMEIISPDDIKVTGSGTFTVDPCGNRWGADILGNFSTQNQLNAFINKSGIAIVSEKGTYSLADPITGVTKSGTYVVENTVSRSQPGGAIELIKSGLLFVDESDATTSSSSDEPQTPGDNGYCLFDDYIFDAPDSDGNCGNGVYSVTDPVTNVYSSGSYTIQQASTTNNTDGSIDTKRQGVIYVEGLSQDSSSASIAYPSIITNGATFTIEDHLVPVTDPYGHVSFVGNSQYTQVDPETGVTQSESYELLNVRIINDRDGSTRIRKFGVFPIDDESDSSTTQTLQTSTSTTEHPIVSEPHKPLELKKDDLETLIYSLNPLDAIQTPESQPLIVSASGNPLYDATAIVTNCSHFIIDGQLVKRRDDEGNVIALVKTGNYSIRNFETNTTWTGNFEVKDFSIDSTTGDQTESQTDVMAAGTYDVIVPDGSTIGTTRNHAIFSMEDLISVLIDETGDLSATEKGNYSLVDPITGDSTSGSFVVRNSVSKVNSDSSCIDIVKSGVLYVDKPSTTTGSSGITVPGVQSSAVKYGGYFLTDQHLLSVPDSNGNYGTGVYNIKDPITNEYMSGTYLIQEASVVNNTDGTQDVTTSGLIYVDSSRSSTTSPNTDPLLIVIDGAKFKFVDHLSYVTDPYGRLTVVGTGEFTQTDPTTNTVTIGKYVIQDIVTNDNPDGSQDAIESGIFYTTDTSTTTSTSSDDTVVITDPILSSNANLGDLKASLQTLLGYLETAKTQTNPTSSQLTSSDAASTTISGSTSATSVSETKKIPDSVVLQRSSVVSAINGQCLSSGDVVVVQANNGAVLIATIQDSGSQVTFYVTDSADLPSICRNAANNKIWYVSENDFSKQDRSLFDAVLNPVESSPCST